MDDPDRCGQEHSCFAARRPAGAEYPVTLTKDGALHRQRMPDGTEREILACGLACSECFSGKNLYKILKPGLDYEMRSMENLRKGLPAEALSIHTSSGVPEPLGPFLEALKKYLPWKNKEELDFCVSLQIEGASAVWAAIDMVLQVSAFESGKHDRTKVAVGATSYHGPPSTSFGAKSPIWKKHHQLIYPVPTAFGAYDEDLLLKKYEAFLDTHGHEVGVMLLEPQWGSSQAALPWPKHLLKKYISLARERGIKIICDEIMCGLGRHGKGTLFVSEAWDLDPDAVTFGKAIAGGVFQMSGAVLKKGRKILEANKCSVLQSHTYAGSSTRALMAATAVLETVGAWLPTVAKLGEEMAHIMAFIMQASEGLISCQGQGLMWGGIITHEGECSDAKFRSNAVQLLKKNCEAAGVIPYFVPVGGFMVSPVLDISVDTLFAIGERLEEAVRNTVQESGWKGPQAVEAPAPRGHLRAPSIASASTLSLAELAAQSEAEKSTVAMTKDLGNDKCVPNLRTARVGKRFNSFVSQDGRIRFLNQ